MSMAASWRPFELPPRPRGARPTVYLAGAIEHAPDNGAGWRRELGAWIRETLGHDVLDPSEHDFQQLTDEERARFREWKLSDPARFAPLIHRIIDHDLRLLVERTDYVVVRWCGDTTRGGGTHGELTVCRLLGIPVYLKLDVARAEVSSWILGCADETFEDWDALRAFLQAKHRGGRA
jgi:hypothetical protein